MRVSLETMRTQERSTSVCRELQGASINSEPLIVQHVVCIISAGGPSWLRRFAHAHDDVSRRRFARAHDDVSRGR
jgi:hypothetical protein